MSLLLLPLLTVSLYNRCCCSYGRLDYCLNNAGDMGTFAPTADYPVDVFDQVRATHTVAQHICHHSNTVHWSCQSLARRGALQSLYAARIQIAEPLPLEVVLSC
jgi:NAD(P)-dependent dehydrogenase (short-subunit alcohol dehydrogenase family)